MSLALRIMLVIGALAGFYIICKRVKNSKMQIMDSIYWIVLSVFLVIVAIFPGIPITISAWLGFISPSNFVFLVIVALLLVKIFSNSIEISMLRHKVEELAQEAALRDAAGDHASARGDVSEKGTRSQP